jgi:hypothetical protein
VPVPEGPVVRGLVVRIDAPGFVLESRQGIAQEVAHYAMDNDLTLKAAALKFGSVTEDEFDRVVEPAKMVKSYVATDK